MCIILLIRKHHGEAVPVLINLSSPSVPKLCVPNFRAWRPAYEEIVGLHRVLGFCLHLVSSALVAAVLDAYTAPLTSFDHTLCIGNTPYRCERICQDLLTGDHLTRLSAPLAGQLRDTQCFVCSLLGICCTLTQFL